VEKKMATLNKTPLIWAGVAASMLLLAGCEKSSEPAPVSFKMDVMPILSKHCYECHLPGGEGQVASGLDMSSYEMLMKGTKYGAVIRPGDSASSTLSILIEGRADPSLRMPHGDRPPLTEAETKIIAEWINQGAKNN